MDGNGNFITTWYLWDAWGSASPYSVAVGSDGSVYVTTDRFTIQKYDSKGTFDEEWGRFYGDYSAGPFLFPYGIAVGPDGSVYVADTKHHQIQKMTSTINNIETIITTSIPIVQSADTMQEYISSIGAVNEPGKFYLQATLKNSLGQTLAQALHPFYVVGSDISLQFNTDKRIYKSGETITISGEVKNLSSVDASNISLGLKRKVAEGTAETVLAQRELDF